MNTQLINAIVPALLAFLVSAVACKLLIPVLYQLKFGQYIREDGPQSHLKKAGTPTMGGISFVVAILLVSILFIKGHTQIIPILIVTVGFGVVGFLDDYIKIVMKHNEGLKPKQKLFLQLVVAAIFCYYLLSSDVPGIGIMIPFTGITFKLPAVVFVIFYLIVVLGTDNGVNLTDGLDGLCSTVTLVVAVFFTIASVMTGAGIEAVTSAVAGSLAGFLLFNCYPAKVFMGDTGSLALGGFVASTAFMMNMPIYIAIVGFIYLLETVSVMIQVAYFKKTGGKRFFKMAPIHHHFEACGWSETRVVTVFALITAFLCLIALLSIG